MTRCTLLFLILLLSACASFDRTNIPPGQRVQGLGFSFTVPTEKSWFAAEYGTSHRIKLTQLNNEDSFSILISVNRGPTGGMYPNAESHLRVLQRHKGSELRSPRGFFQVHHEEWIDSRYGKLCVRYSSFGEDWTARNDKGPKMVKLIGLSCAHQKVENTLISIEVSRRYETGAAAVDLSSYADEVFSSLEFESID